MAANTPAQLNFLTDAAHLLRQSAPETSAYLMSRRTQLSVLQEQNSLELTPVLTDVQRQRICSCCGHLMVPGLDGTTIRVQSARQQLDKAKKPSAKKPSPQKHGQAGRDAVSSAQTVAAARTQRQRLGIQKIISCGSCRRDTRVVLPPPAPLSKKRKLVDKAIDSKATPDMPATVTPGSVSKATAKNTATALSSNASSKKRAKNRKAGLLAMLDKSRSSGSSSAGLGLSFNDFRKK